MTEYVIKANLLLIVLWVFYALIIGKDTRFKFRRATLLCGIAVALLCPLLTLPQETSVRLSAVNQLPEILALPGNSGSTEANSGGFSKWILIVYFAVMLLLFAGMLMRLVSLWKLVHQCRQTELGGLTLYQVPGYSGSLFSFFGFIFIPENSPVEDFMLKHEITHVRQLHSLDIIAAELLTVVFWYNPAAWLLRNDIRDNLEYLADAAASKLTDRRTYQLGLISGTSQSAIAKFYNNFNVSSLKRRIKMMNRKKSRNGAYRYILGLPLAALMIAIGSKANSADSELIASTASEKSTAVESAAVNSNPATDMASESESTTDNSSLAIVSATADASSATDKTPQTKSSPNKPAEGDLPQFPGGQIALMKSISANLVYPKSAFEDTIQGRVVVSFTVDKDGNVVKPEVIKGVRADLDSAAVSAVLKSPKWIPAKNGHECQMVVPVTFKLK